jgi:hypothetical protein
MSTIKVTIEGFSDALEAVFNQYNREVTDGIKEASDKAIKLCNEEAKNRANSWWSGSDYVKKFSTKTTKNTEFEKVNVWYVKKPKYRLTHLLENGHRIVVHGVDTGKMTKPRKHIEPASEIAKKQFESDVTEIIKNGRGG